MSVDVTLMPLVVPPIVVGVNIDRVTSLDPGDTGVAVTVPTMVDLYINAAASPAAVDF